MAFDDADIFHCREIPIARSGVQQDAARGVAVPIDKLWIGGTESADVPELLHAPVIRIAAEAGVGEISDAGRRPGRAVGERQNGAQLPTAKDSVRHTAHGAVKVEESASLALADGDLIKQRADKPPAHVLRR